MIKPESLRGALTAALPQLARDPDKLLVYIDKGSIQATAAHGLSFEYAYTLQLIFTDYAGSPDAVMVPLLAWIKTNQRELLDNIDQRRHGMTFEADILNNDQCDLAISLPLTEIVIVKRTADGRLDIVHAPEPQPEDDLVGHWQLYSRDELLAEWKQPA